MLSERRGARNVVHPLALRVRTILAWAEAHRKRIGKWPHVRSGPIPDAPGESWLKVDAALRHGFRGSPGGSSLTQLLAKYRKAPNLRDRPPLSEGQIVHWAGVHYKRTGAWPTQESGRIVHNPWDTWHAVGCALKQGLRGLPGGRTLAELLEAYRGIRNVRRPPPLAIEMILGWADAHHERTGRWPTTTSGSVSRAPGETWTAIEQALSHGSRGLSGGSSLAKLLAECRGARNHKHLSRLTEQQILAWADAHHDRTGEWPSQRSSWVIESNGETWSGVNTALRQGLRGLKGDISLFELLVTRRGLRDSKNPPRLYKKAIISWAKAHHRRTGQWPRARTGGIPEAPGESWLAIDAALTEGRRGFPGRSTLAKLLDQHVRTRSRKARPIAR